jgi:protein involved in polysaccharide export with SLBB domain
MVPSGSALRSNPLVSGKALRASGAALLALAPGLVFAQPSCTEIDHKPKGPVVYIVGAVKRPCMYFLEKRETITVAQALALAGGLSETASSSGAKVFHRPSEGPTVVVPVDLRKWPPDETQDIELGPGDVLLVPDSRRPSQRASPHWDPPMVPGPTLT